MTDTVLDEIKAAQGGLKDLYMVWAEIGTDQIVLHSAQLPQSIDAETVLSRIRAQAEQTLAACGYSAEQIAAASLYISVLPSVEETEAELEAQRGPDVEIMLVDLTTWEACRHRLHLSSYAVENGAQEMDFKGLKIRRSVAG